MGYSSFCVYIQLLMVLRMVYWCTPIGIMLQRSISYTLASLGRNCLLYFLSKHMCKSYNPNSQHICRGSNCYHMEFMKLVHILLHMVNMLGQAILIQLNFNSYLCIRVVINYQNRGRLKALVWFWLIDETLSANLVYQVFMRQVAHSKW